jgi:nucleotide-binding universal stress UspA family protein
MAGKILCAVDDTEHSKHAVAVAAGLAKATGAELTLLAVNQLMGGSGGKSAVLAEYWQKEQLGKILDSAAATAKQSGVGAPKTASVVSRDVGRAIVSFAEDSGADHIVVGSGGKGAVSRLMIGSVSRDVVDRAHCPVTIAR